jgi:hypothetical protein
MDKSLHVEQLGKCPIKEPFCATRDDLAPLFTADSLVNGEIRKLSLEQYKGKWMLLFFYTSDFTFV